MTNLVDQLTSFQSRLLMAIHGIPDGDLRRPEGEGKWSVFNVITHLSDLELLTNVRLLMIVAEESPQLPRFTQTAWAGKLHHDEPLADVLENFWHARRRNVAFLQSLNEEQLQKSALHADYGPVTVPRLLEFVAAHQENHLGQIERVKSFLGLVASPKPNLHGITAGVAKSAPARSPGPGVRVRTLWQRGVSRALQVEMDAGSQWPGIDYHIPGPEEVFIVSGDFHDGANQYAAGTFLHHPAGSSHSPTSRDGCVLFVYYPEG